jgi:hypothetical protein
MKKEFMKMLQQNASTPNEASTSSKTAAAKAKHSTSQTARPAKVKTAKPTSETKKREERLPKGKRAKAAEDRASDDETTVARGKADARPVKGKKRKVPAKSPDSDLE